MRIKGIWIAMTMLAVSAEGSAMAQSAPAPAHACGPNDVTLACMVQWSAPVGPELAAARASLGGTTKKGDTGAPVDLNSLANRQATTGSTGGNGLVLPHAGESIQSNGGGSDSLQVLHGGATTATSTTSGPAARVVAPGSFQDGWAASTSTRAPLAETVVRGQINPAAKSCYENDPDSKAKRPGRLIILIKLTPAGDVDSVSVANNAGLSPSVASCITTAAGAAKFAPPAPNATSVRASFTFPAQDDLVPPTAARGSGALGANGPGQPAHDALAKSDTPPAKSETAHP
jgi:hypothetical protein